MLRPVFSSKMNSFYLFIYLFIHSFLLVLKKYIAPIGLKNKKKITAVFSFTATPCNTTKTVLVPYPPSHAIKNYLGHLITSTTQHVLSPPSWVSTFNQEHSVTDDHCCIRNYLQEIEEMRQKEASPRNETEGWSRRGYGKQDTEEILTSFTYIPFNGIIWLLHFEKNTKYNMSITCFFMLVKFRKD